MKRTQAVQNKFALVHGYVDGDKVSASYKYGVLKLVVPKKEEAKPRTIKITE